MHVHAGNLCKELDKSQPAAFVLSLPGAPIRVACIARITDRARVVLFILPPANWRGPSTLDENSFLFLPPA